MNMKKVLLKALLIAIFWVVYIFAMGSNEQVTYKVMTLLGIMFIHLGILECIDVIFDRKSEKSQDVNYENLKSILVWSDENRKYTAETMRSIINKLSKEHDLKVTHVFYDKTLEFYTSEVRVRFITKIDEYKGLKYDKAFGFNSKPYAGPLIEYIIEQHDI